MEHDPELHLRDAPGPPTRPLDKSTPPPPTCTPEQETARNGARDAAEERARFPKGMPQNPPGRVAQAHASHSAAERSGKAAPEDYNERSSRPIPVDSSSTAAAQKPDMTWLGCYVAAAQAKQHSPEPPQLSLLQHRQYQRLSAKTSAPKDTGQRS